MLGALAKQMFTFDGAGHSLAFERFEDLHHILVDTILPVSYPDGRN